MKIDNFDQIGKLLMKDSDEYFYDVQILRRSKDHPELPAANFWVKNICIKGAENLEKYRAEIIKLCEAFEARAYICVCRKSNQKCMLKALECFSQRLYDGDYKKPQAIWWHAVGTVKPQVRYWVIDIDKEQLDKKDVVIGWLEDWYKHCFSKRTLAGIVDIVPTISGIHIITSPFRRDTFTEAFPDIEIKEHGLTLLYA